MIRPRAGLLIFHESRAREDVYQKRKPIADREIARFIASLEDEVDLICPDEREIRGKRSGLQAARELQAAHVDAVILYIPIFVAPAVVAHTANLLNVPIVLACNEAEDSLSQLAFLAAGGAMDQLALPYLRLPGDAVDDENHATLLCFLRAAAARERLRGQTYGCIGGRSLGISSGRSDLVLWENIFGVDIEHIDQFEIVRRAEAIDEDVLQKHLAWLRAKAGRVACNESNFTPVHLEKQVRSYLATRQICVHYELDFIGIKCQPEMSNGYCLQCVNVSLCNDPYDADGPRETIPCACEADSDGALTMQILKLISGGKPTSLNDIAWLSETEMTLANCGAMATCFADPSLEEDKSLKRVELVPHSFGEAGGASVQFTVPRDQKMTFARLYRQGGRYELAVLTGTTVEKDRGLQSATIRVRPLIFLEMNIDKQRFLQSFGSNHIHAVRGDLKQELAMFARLCDIGFVDHDLE